jgi:hypothetical protein
MPYTPPAGNAGDVSWSGASSYSAPAGNAGDVTWFGVDAVVGALAASYSPVAEVDGKHGEKGTLASAYNPTAAVFGRHTIAGDLDASYAPIANIDGLTGNVFIGSLAASYLPVADIAAAHGERGSVAATYVPLAAYQAVRGVSGSVAATYDPNADVDGSWLPEPSFTISVPISITVEANQYTLSLPVRVVVESAPYTIDVPVAVTVEANSYTIGVPVKVVIDEPPYTHSLPVSIRVIDPGVLDGDWTPEVFIDGEEIDHDLLEGVLRVTRRRGETASCEVSYILDTEVAGSFSVTHFRKKSVIVDAVSGSDRIRVFTGKVQTASWDRDIGVATLFCMDSLEDHLINISMNDVEGLVSSAHWSQAVFGERPTRGRDYLDQLLEVEPVSMQCDPYDMLTPAPLVPEVAVATITPDTVSENSQVVREVDGKNVINRVEIELTSRGAACYGRSMSLYYRMGDSLNNPYTSPAWLYSLSLGGRLMDRGMIASAVSSTGWRQISNIDYVPPPVSVVHNVPGVAGSTSEFGDNVFWLNPPSLADKFAVEFSCAVSKEWGQTVEVKDKLVVQWQASINTYGLLTEQEAYLAETDFDVQAWESSKGDAATVTEGADIDYGGRYTNGEEEPTGGVTFGGAGYGLAPHIAGGVVVKIGRDGLGWGYTQQAINCGVLRAQNEIYKSHLGEYSFDLLHIAPALQIGAGIAIGEGLHIESAAPMPIEGITHTWDYTGNNASCFTSLELGYVPVGSSASEAGHAPITYTPPEFGVDFIDLSPSASSLSIVYSGETESGENRLEITIGEVEDEYRETLSLDRTDAPLVHGVWCAANNLTITALERP